MRSDGAISNNASAADEVAEDIFHALGRAASKLWSNLPQEIQHQLFEAAVSFHGNAMRQQLAVFLHERHSRTTDSMKALAVTEPDSLGG
jgi:hypothetical protein